MGVERRRAGFRLPWTADGDEGNGAEASATQADEAASAVAQTLPAADAAVTAGTAADSAADSAAQTPASPGAAVTAGTAAESVAETPATPGAPVTADTAAERAAETPAADATDASAPTTEAESSDFLQSLVAAMRGVAQTSRDASLSDLRTEIDARIEALATQSAEQENDLRRRSELDLQSVGEWEHTEVERIKGEAERKRDARRAQLEQQLAEHRTTSEREVEATRNRLAEHERNLAEFFAQLSEISDPAAFVAAAKRMPRPPEASHVEAAASAPAAEDPRLAALGMSPDAPAPPETAPPQTAPPETAPPETAHDAKPGTDATADTSDTSAEAGTSEATGTLDTAEVPGTTPAPEATAEGGGIPESRLAERLAQLDQRISGGTQPVAAAAPTSAGSNGGETSTPIVVKGLGSFGAITSFKQALERVEGVRGVTLSLGPTGEFVYRASHAGEFDLVSAIQGIEGPTATIEHTEGTLVVTLSRAR